MVENDISAVLINDATGRLIGIVTERDLARRVWPPAWMARRRGWRRS